MLRSESEPRKPYRCWELLGSLCRWRAAHPPEPVSRQQIYRRRTSHRVHEVTLYEEELYDVSLGTFFVFDKEGAGTPRLAEKFARGGIGACGGTGGRCAATAASPGGTGGRCGCGGCTGTGCGCSGGGGGGGGGCGGGGGGGCGSCGGGGCGAGGCGGGGCCLTGGACRIC